MPTRPVYLEGAARRTLQNVHSYGSAFPGGSMIDLSIEGHVLDSAPGGDPRISPDPAPSPGQRPGLGVIGLILVALLVAGG